MVFATDARLGISIPAGLGHFKNLVYFNASVIFCRNFPDCVVRIVYGRVLCRHTCVHELWALGVGSTTGLTRREGHTLLSSQCADVILTSHTKSSQCV